MTKLDVFNLTLQMFNINPVTEEEYESMTEDDKAYKDIATLERFYPVALRKASRDHRWWFLEVKFELSDDLGSAHGYKHSYELPEDYHSLTWADGERYKVIGNILYTDGKGEAYGYVKDIIPTEEVTTTTTETDDEGNETEVTTTTNEAVSYIPEDFYDLVAYVLAYLTAYRFNPELKSSIAQDYQLVELNLIGDELRHGRKEDDTVVDGWEDYRRGW